MSDTSLLVEWALFGAPRLGPSGQFAAIRDLEGMDSRTVVGGAFQGMVAEIADWYKGEIGRRFAETHGRTGETEASIHGEVREVTGDMYQYAISVGGHIGAVITPLPPHWIDMNGIRLAGPNPDASRMVNLYSDFGPRDDVYWYQGGAESYSPDRSWYEDAQAALELQGQTKLNMLGGLIQQQWALAGESVPWTRGQARLNIARYRSQVSE